MNMKKLLKPVLSLTLAFSLFAGLGACGGKGESKKSEAAGESVPAADAGMTIPAGETMKGSSDVEAEIQKLIDQENDIFEADKALWDKVFLAANKNSTMISDGSNYGDFLLKTIESAKAEFSADELKKLKAGAEKIRELDAKAKELEKKIPKDAGKKENSENGASSNASAMQKFPSFKGKDLDGNEIDNSYFSKRAVTVVNFWFSTCGPCVAELGDLDALNKELNERDGSVVGINTFTFDDNKDAIAAAKEILKKKGASYTNLTFASDSEAGKFAEKIMAFPTTFVVDRDGNIVGDPIMGSIAEGNQNKALKQRIEEVIEKDKDKVVPY